MGIIMNRNQLQQGQLLIRTGFFPDLITSIPTMTPYHKHTYALGQTQTHPHRQTDTETHTHTTKHARMHTHAHTHTHTHTGRRERTHMYTSKQTIKQTNK